MTVSESTFRNALLDAGKPVPLGLQNARGAPAGARFSVYRNNVVVSLTEALATAFPLVRKLLGKVTFDKLARLYVREHPPSSPVMMFYGGTLPSFLEQFEPLRHIGYLPDCARLDLAMRQSYHAADSAAFDAAVLQTKDSGATVRLALTPATHILQSPWPIYDIWRFNMVAGSPKPSAIAQDVLISRPEFDPQLHLLPAGAAFWLGLLKDGATLGEAVEKATKNEPEFDLTQALTLALSSSALANHLTKETQ